MAVLFVPVLFTMLATGLDYAAHTNFAIQWQRTGEFSHLPPQFLYHVLLVSVYRLIPGESYPLAVAIIGAASYIAAALIIFGIFYPEFNRFSPRLRFAAAFGITVVMMLVGSINLFTWGKTGTLLDTYFGYITPNSFHSPTLILMKPFALVLFGYAVKVFAGEPSRGRGVWVCFAIAFLCTLAKPNYSIALIPALGLMSVYSIWKRQPLDWRLLIVGIGLPIIGLLGWQFLYQTRGRGGFAFEPLRVMNDLSPDGLLLPKLLLSIVFPAAVYLLYWPQTRHDTAFTLAWLSFGIALAYLYTMVEVNYWSAGNFQWGTQITLLILFLIAARLLIRQYMASRQWTWRLTVCVILLALHFVGGLAVYLPYLTGAQGT
jgi:hypothetical protein